MKKENGLEKILNIIKRFLKAAKRDSKANTNSNSKEEEDAMNKLLTRVLGDVDKAERLIQFERVRSPNDSRLSLILSAIRDLDRHR